MNFVEKYSIISRELVYSMILTDRHRTIDFIKGVCILIIIFTHYTWSDSERLKFLFPFWVDMAVPMFMIISGFVYSKSFEKRKIVQIEEAYLLYNLLDKVIRYSIPFIITFMVEELIFCLLGVADVSVSQVVMAFLRGGSGAGSYYYPIMIQFIFWFPIIFFIIKRYDVKGFCICFLINFIYELLQRAYGMGDMCYRLLVFRYTLVIAFGCYLAIGKRTLDKLLLIVCTLLGIIYIILFRYVGLTPLITIHWTGTSFWACLYILPISLILLKTKLNCKVIECIGRASYNIFLIQMVYFNFAGYIYNLIPCRIIQILFNIVFCAIGGIVFYYIEMPITKYIKEKVLLIIAKYNIAR